MSVLGFDTSNYTTSAAWFDGSRGENAGKLLEVKPGELGLRQSEALFQHVKRLPEIVAQLPPLEHLTAVGASTRPRAVEGSYMPCFLAGESQGRVLARTLGVPFYGFSHQQGHLAAVLWSAGRPELLEERFLAWHLSGGTTELLLVEKGLNAKRIGGTADLSAGQLIDRTGLLLGLDFPAGKALDALAAQGNAKPFALRVRDMEFSLSGMQNKAEQMRDRGASPADTAAFTLETVARAVRSATEQALGQYGNLPVVFTGGVSSNTLLRRRMASMEALFGTPECSTDNALGIAVLTDYTEKQHG